MINDTLYTKFSIYCQQTIKKLKEEGFNSFNEIEINGFTGCFFEDYWKGADRLMRIGYTSGNIY
jgi:hypothetical protein